MDDGMIGADADALMATSRQFGRSAEALKLHRAHLTSIYAGAEWVGADADRSRREWLARGSPALLRTSEFLETLETRLLDHAAEQRNASAASRPRFLPATTEHREPADDRGVVTDDRGRGPSRWRAEDVGFFASVTALADDVRGRADTILDVLLGGHEGESAEARVAGLRPSVFDAPSDGRSAVVAAMRGLADENRIGRDEIEIRALDNGRYVVVLPGVTDLSAGLEQFVDRVRDDPFAVGEAGGDAYDAWADNDEPTVRKMRYAFEAAVRDDTSTNEYAVVTAEALESAGVPAGAEVMLIGHSFGAYAAMDLAADQAFNSAHGASPSGYHVSVTHVVAAGAETDWRFDEVPADTNALVINNRFDLVYRVENVLHGDGDAEQKGHVEQNFWGGWQGKGHDEHNYIDWIEGTGNSRVNEWLDGAGETYADSGTRVSVRVPDPNL